MVSATGKQKNSPRVLPAILDGELIRVAKVAASRTGQRPSPFTEMRWCMKGLRRGRIKLAAVWTGSYWATTPAAYDQFLSEQTAARLQDNVPESASDDDLRAAGLL